MAVRALYERTLQERGYSADEAQLRAIAALERCENEWLAYLQRRRGTLARMLNKPPIPRGVYMYGGVGRGKSFLMDCFFNEVPLLRKTRLHFHEFDSGSSLRRRCFFPPEIPWRKTRPGARSQ